MKMEKINLNELENVNGGTYGESLSLVVRLAFPSEDGQNIFVDREGLKYGQDYIENLLVNGSL